MAQYITIDNSLMTAVFHCPICGSQAFSELGEPTNRPCDHLLFSWISEIGEFDNAAVEVKAIFSGGEEDGLDEYSFAPWDEKFQQLLPEHAVLFAFESQGMACGPVSLTIVHGIKYPAPYLEPRNEA